MKINVADVVNTAGNDGYLVL